jgi:hypothetical protein
VAARRDGGVFGALTVASGDGRLAMGEAALQCGVSCPLVGGAAPWWCGLVFGAAPRWCDGRPPLLREVRHYGGAHLTCDSGGRWVLGGCWPVKLLDAWEGRVR